MNKAASAIKNLSQGFLISGIFMRSWVHTTRSLRQGFLCKILRWRSKIQYEIDFGAGEKMFGVRLQPACLSAALAIPLHGFAQDRFKSRDNLVDLLALAGAN